MLALYKLGVPYLCSRLDCFQLSFSLGTSILLIEFIISQYIYFSILAGRLLIFTIINKNSFNFLLSFFIKFLY